MKVYLSANSEAPLKLQQRYSSIIDALHHGGVLVMSNIVAPNISGFSNSDMEKISQSGMILLDKMDGIIIEGTKPSSDAGYIIALALAHKKPILYLVEKGKPLSPNIAALQKHAEAKKLLIIAKYSPQELLPAVTEFVGGIEQGEGRESPNIKFTLRITPRIERYLHWKTHNTKLTKADFLRELIEDLIDEDKGYETFEQK